MRTIPLYLLAAFTLLATGCATAPRSESARETLEDNVQTTLNRFQREKPDMPAELKSAAGYAVFPAIGKGGAGVGGAYGRGMLYEHGQPTGFCDMTQASFGFQLGGQSYAELLLLEDDAALSRFKNNTAQVGANASAVAITAGAHGNAHFNNGMAIYTLTNGGLMYEAVVTGQRFTYSAQPGLAADRHDVSDHRDIQDRRDVPPTDRPVTPPPSPTPGS